MSRKAKTLSLSKSLKEGISPIVYVGVSRIGSLLAAGTAWRPKNVAFVNIEVGEAPYP